MEGLACEKESPSSAQIVGYSLLVEARNALVLKPRHLAA